MRHNTEEFLGVDVGDRRVGIARGSSAARIAEPLKTVATDSAVAELLDLARQNQAGGVVVGLPRSLEAQDTAQTKTVRQWAKRAQTDIKLPFYWQDEALTSRAAATKLQASNPKIQNAGSDAVAAAIILQDFLDTPADQRVRC